MTTYTIITDSQSGMLLCTVPDGSDLNAAIAAQAANDDIPPYSLETCAVYSGLTLTNDADESDEIIYSGNTLGWLSDETGSTYDYAVRRA